ncbi:hypothetical protein [Anaerosporobacter sp.]|uniref:hypothetical protein n=1 Tax=Anaerosporobacter sp. TaxID=1872529 RepID=UPI00286EF6A2|nr:hypothetical protein [Anaerosporobacter sp.]
MSENNSKALLSQNEIDTLVRFLVDQKQGIQSSVLTQESIDKLVHLLSSKDLELLKFDITGITNDSSNETEEILSNLIHYDNSLEYELSFQVIDNKVVLTATNSDTNTTLHITPKSLEVMSLVEDESFWGCCIEPNLFDKIATVFHFKYRHETLDAITKLFTETMYGSASLELPNIYRPSTLSVSQNLIN